MPERFFTFRIHAQSVGMAVVGSGLTLGAQEWTHPVKECDDSKAMKNSIIKAY